MAQTLFDLQRIWDAWPSLKNHQGLRDLFRKMSPDSPSQELRISNVFVVPGHIFIAVSSKVGVVPRANVSSRAVLYVFSCVPLSDHPKATNNHMTTACLLELSRLCTEVLGILDISKDNHAQVLVVQNNGEVCTFRCNPLTQIWTLNESYQLSSNVLLHSCYFTTPPHTKRLSTRVFLYCASNKPSKSLSPSSSSRSSPAMSSSTSSSSSYSYQVILRRCEIAPNGSFILGQSSVLLDSCPALDFIAFKGGICFLPCQEPYPKGLLLFWAPGDGEPLLNLRAYVWNEHAPAPFPILSSYPQNFKNIVLSLAGMWTKAPDEPSLVSLATHPFTEQLLALDSAGGVYSIEVANTGTIRRNHLVTLSYLPFPSTLSLFPSSSSIANKPRLFLFYTYYGVCFHGDIRLYDSFSGEFLWECNEHEGPSVRLWTTERSPGYCGIYGNSGMYILRGQKMADHAVFMARGLFPVKTNADETTPGEYLKDGQLIAAQLSKMWGLNLLATKYALEAVFDAVKNEDGSAREAFNATDIPLEMVSLLDEGGALQNPALLVTLLSDFPLYRPELTRRVAKFLQAYHSNTPIESANDLLTPLNKELVPLLEKYVELSREMDTLLGRKDATSVQELSSVLDVRSAVQDLLRQSEQLSFQTTEPLKSQFHSLCCHHPDQALLGIKDFLGVEDFQKAVQELEEGKWESQRQWRDIFATEIAVRVERSYLKASIDRIPLFEETCRLLYTKSPEELLTFVTFAQLARDHQAAGDSAFARKSRKDFFCHRAVNALPMFISMEATPTKPEAIRVYCHLLLNSDLLNSEMMAVKLLLANHMWEDAIQLVEKNQQQDSHSFLFHCLLTGLSKGGTLNTYIDRVWTLIPAKFNIFDFLTILKNTLPHHHPFLAPEGSAVVTVSSVAPKLKDLLQRLVPPSGPS